MAVTHADLEPNRPRAELGSKISVFLMVLSVLFGFICFILCLVAEATRSQVIWAASSDAEGEENNRCSYSGSGKTPLLCAAGAFAALAIAVVVEHTNMLFAVSKSPALVYWNTDTDPAKALTWQAGFFFVTTWVCFAVGEIFLLIGLSIESGHLKGWSEPKPICLIIRQGMFSAAGVLSLCAVFLACGLYVTALRAQNLFQAQENVRREVLEASVLYASPPRSPGHHLAPVANENPIAREDRDGRPLFQYMPEPHKNSILV